MQSNNSKNVLGNYSMCTCSVAQPCQTLCTPRDCSPLCSSVHGIFFFFSGKNTGVGCLFLFQGIFSKGIKMVVPEMSTLSGGFFATEPPVNPNCSISHSVLSDCLGPQGLQHTRLPCPSPTPGACSNSHLLSR